MILIYEGKAPFILPATTLSSKDPKIKSILVNADGDKITIEFETDYATEVEALHATSKESARIEKEIYFTFQEEILNLDWKIGETTNSNGNKSFIIHDSVNLSSTLTIKRSYSYQDVNKLIINLENRKSETAIYNLFIDIQKMKDKIGSYIMLYSLLIIYAGPSQKKIDRYIKRKFPEVEMRPTTREGEDYEETVYTSLRNQLGHLQVDTDTDTNKITTEINSHYKGFSELVKQMLVEKRLL